MKTERILVNIQNISYIESLPAKGVAIKKVSLMKDMNELKSRLPFLKKAILCQDKILFEKQAFIPKAEIETQ